MRSQQVLQVLQNSGHLAATIAPRTAALSSVKSVLDGILSQQITGTLVANPVRSSSTEVSSTASDQLQSEDSPAAVAAAAVADATPASASTTDAPMAHRTGWVAWKEGHLQEAGLWVPKDEYDKLSAEQQAQVQLQRSSYLWKIKQQERLQQLPASNMLIRVSARQNQLESVVVAIADKKVRKNRTADAAGINLGASSIASSSDDDELSHAPAENWQPRNSGNTIGRRQQERWQSVQDESSLWQQNNMNSEPDIDYAAAAADASAAAANGEFNLTFLTSPQLDSRSLVRSSTESMIVNLNTQLVRLAHEDQHLRIVQLFDELIERGMQLARELQQQQQQQKEQQQQQDQQKPARAEPSSVLVLPRQYRPDHSALAIYCRSLTWLTINIQRYERLRAGCDHFSPLTANDNKTSSIHRAERAAALWGSWTVGRGGPGLQVHSALLTAYKVGNKPKKALEFFYMLRAANSADHLNHYRLHLTAVEAAINAQNFPAADELARVFSSGIIAYKEADYKLRLASIYRRLAVGAAASKQWERALHWLQMLIDNYMLVPVHSDDFYNVMVHAAIAGRMDYVKLLITAADQHLKHQSGQPVRYTEDKLKLLLDAAARAQDVELIEMLWQRLLLDTAASRSSRSSSSKKKQDSESAKPRPSASAYQCVIRALVDCEQWSRALELVDEFDGEYGERHTGPGRSFAAVSVFDGLKSFPMSLDTESKVAAVFEALKARKDAGLPVTTCLMNIICRSIARLGNTEAAGTVFQSYGVWNIAHDADSYNAIMECCEINKKVVGAESLISYMASKGVKPNAATWNLLLSTAIRAGDRRTAVSAIERTMAAGHRVRRSLVKRAGGLAYDPPDFQLQAALEKVCKHQGLDMLLLAEAAKYQQRQPAGQQDARSRRISQPLNADVWTPQHQQQADQQLTEQQQQKQQQQQQQEQGDKAQDKDSKSEAESGLRSQLRGAFGR